MGNLKVWDNCILLAVIIILDNSNSTKRTGEGFTNGQENNQIFIKASLSKGKGMVEGHSGGQMEAGMKANLEMVYKVAMESCIEMEAILNMRGPGIMECLMERALSISKMGRSMKDRSNRTNSMAMEYSIRMIPLSTEFGRTINYQS